MGSEKEMLEDEIKGCTSATNLIQACEAIVDSMLSLQAALETGSTSAQLSKEERVRLSQLLSIQLARIKELVYNDIVNSKAEAINMKFLVELNRSLAQDSSMLLPKLLGIMPTEFVPFETRKNFAAIFNFLLTGPISDVFSEYTLLHYHDLMTPLCSGMDSQSSPDTSLLCGAMFRSTLKHNALYRKLLDSFPEEQTNSNTSNNSKSEISSEYEISSMPQVQQPISSQHTTCRERYLYPLMDRQVFVSNFDLASDALTTLREIFTSNTEIASEYLERDYDTVFAKYNIMLQSESYVTKRMSLKLLGELLLNRKYVYFRHAKKLLHSAESSTNAPFFLLYFHPPVIST